jgi:ribosomal protein S18 acetylase RimI-like enzyme
MAVLPTYRRHGVGAALLEATMRRAGELNLQTLMVGVHRSSEAAQSFFTRAGFTSEPVMQLKLR